MVKIELKEGWLVAGDVHLCGCTKYVQRNRQETLTGKQLDGSWETVRVTEDAEEEKTAQNICGRVRRRLKKIGAVTGVGYFVLKEDEPALRSTLKEVTDMVNEFNQRARFAKVSLDIAIFDLHSDNTAALRSLVSTATTLLTELRTAMSNANVVKMRDVIQRANGLETFLPEEQGEVLRDAFESARRAAREMTRAAKKTNNNLEAIRGVADVTPVEAALYAMSEMAQALPCGLTLPCILSREVEVEAVGAEEPSDKAYTATGPRIEPVFGET